MYICPQKLASFLMCNSNINFPLNNSHYASSKDIAIFSKLICIENELTNLTCSLKGYYNSCKNNLCK